MDKSEGSENDVQNDMDSKAASPAQPPAHRVKRRRTRSERNKLHDMLHPKRNKENISDMKKHAKKDMNLTVDKKVEMVCAITQNRLTRRLGLFNKGKKSDTIKRDSVQAQTNEDMERILCRDDDNDVTAVNLEDFSKRFSDGETSTTRKRHASQGKVTPGSARSIPLPSSGSPQNVQLMEVDSQPTVTDDESPPENPDIASVALELLPGVNVRHKFPGRNYLKEVKQKLLRDLKENAPVEPDSPTDETPVKLTPQAQMIGEVIKRNLSNSMPLPDQQPQEHMDVGIGGEGVQTAAVEPCPVQPAAPGPTLLPQNIPSQVVNPLPQQFLPGEHILITDTFQPTMDNLQNIHNAKMLLDFNEKARCFSMSEGSSQSNSQDTMFQTSDSGAGYVQESAPDVLMAGHTLQQLRMQGALLQPHHPHQQVGHDHCYQNGGHRMQLDLRNMFSPFPLEGADPAMLQHHAMMVPDHCHHHPNQQAQHVQHPTQHVHHPNQQAQHMQHHHRHQQHIDQQRLHLEQQRHLEEQRLQQQLAHPGMMNHPHHVTEQESYQHHIHHHKLQQLLQHLHAKNVVTQYVYPVQQHKAMGGPTDAMALLQTCVTKQQQDLGGDDQAMDLLDELDLECDMFPSQTLTDPHGVAIPTVIPAWLRNIPPLTDKPSFDTPPPDKMYPRRMY